jgi:hypothetical protein
MKIQEKFTTIQTLLLIRTSKLQPNIFLAKQQPQIIFHCHTMNCLQLHIDQNRP